MSKAAQSVFVFGVYIIGLGTVLVVAPNLLLRLFGIAETQEVWIRVVGMVVLLLSFYYTQMARKGNEDFFRLTVYARCSVVVFFTAFVVLFDVSPMLILFGAVDFAGGIWTWFALRK